MTAAVTTYLIQLVAGVIVLGCLTVAGLNIWWRFRQTRAQALANQRIRLARAARTCERVVR